MRLHLCVVLQCWKPSLDAGCPAGGLTICCSKVGVTHCTELARASTTARHTQPFAVMRVKIACDCLSFPGPLPCDSV